MENIPQIIWWQYAEKVDVKYQLPQMYPKLKRSTKDKDKWGEGARNSISTKLGNRASFIMWKTKEYLQNMVSVGSVQGNSPVTDKLSSYY